MLELEVVVSLEVAQASALTLHGSGSESGHKFTDSQIHYTVIHYTVIHYTVIRNSLHCNSLHSTRSSKAIIKVIKVILKAAFGLPFS